MARLQLTLSLLLLSCCYLVAQDFSALEFRNLGPYRGGRVTTVTGVASQPGTFYLGATGGGVWKTDDYGTSWNNVSDGFFSTPSIGGIAVAQNDPNVLYVGTGSDGLRSNVIEGKGMYKSIDGGKNWTHIGLPDVGQIGAVRIHPDDHNTVYVAAIGRAFEANPERGLYKTTDGGRNWEQVLFLSDSIGISDVEMLPTNPNILFATAWKAERKPWTILSGGPADQGGIYKSVDAGKTWQRIERGLPSSLIGKIDVEVCPSDSRMVYALVEAPDEEGGLYKSTDQGASFELVSNNSGIRTRPFYYTNVRVDPKNTDIVYVLATGYYKSTDGGKSWERLSPPHGDNHDMWIHPEDPDLFIQANDGGANVTHNGGKTWSTQFNQPTAEIYQVEVDNQYPYWLYGGQQDNYSTVSVPSMAPYGIQAAGIGYIANTGGCETGPAVPHPENPDIVYSNCKGRFTVYNKRTGTEQSYYVGMGNMYGHNPRDLEYRFQRVSPIHVSPHDPSIVYHTSQFVHKTTDEGKTWETISPDLTAFEESKQVISGAPITRDITGEEFYSTIYAIRESPLQAGLIWVGANDGPVHVTRDGGQTWDNVTPGQLPPGGRVDAVEPSPHDPAKAYVSVLRYQLGDRRPHIYKTENYGQSWELITDGIPDDYPVRVVREDTEQEGLLFAGTEYGLFVSMDDGASWKALQKNLPVTPITDLKIHRGDLVLSTMGRGFWMLDDISPLRQSELMASSEPQLLEPRNTIRYRYPSGARNSRYPRYPRAAVRLFYHLPDSMPGTIKLELLNQSGSVVVAYQSDSTEEQPDEIVRNMATEEIEYLVANNLSAKPGLNCFEWDMTRFGPWHENARRRYRNGPMVAPGTYTARLTVGNKTLTQNFEIEMDPRVRESGITAEDIARQEAFQVEIRDLLSQSRKLQHELNKEHKKLKAKKQPSENEKNRMEQIEEALAKLKTAEGIYPQPMLADQLSYLYSALNRADQVPGQDAMQRFENLRNQLEQVQSSTD